MLAALPALLLLSAFFSGSETALFGLSATERMTIRRKTSLVGRAVDSLMASQRMLLITVLVGNMTVNTLYFVITSVLLLKARVGVAAGFALAALFLVILILAGEVIPKLVANSRRAAVVGLIAAPLLTVHKLIGPLRIALEALVVGPLSRLTSPPRVPPPLDEEELAALLDMAGRGGVIDREEQRVLQDIIGLGQLKVRDVMTPRVRVAALPAGAAPDKVRTLAERTRLTKFPVYRGDLDHIVGLLNVREALLAADAGRRLEPVRFVPEMATLDQLLNHFRGTKTQLAVVVDEYGGTAGVVAVEDVVEELVGDITGAAEEAPPAPSLIERGRYRVSADTSVHEWAEAFGQRPGWPQVATLGGLIVAHLGRAPRAGDAVDLGNVHLEVEKVDRSRVVSVFVSLRGGGREASA